MQSAARSYPGGYTKVPNFVVETDVLHFREKAVFIVLLMHDYGSGDAYPSEVRIAALTGIGRPKVGEALARLASLGVISKVGRYRNQAKYVINYDDLANILTVKPRPRGGRPVTGVTDGTARPVTGVTDDLSPTLQMTCNERYTKQNKTNEKNAPLGVTSAGDPTSGRGSRNSIADNSASLLDAGGEADFERESTSASDSIGNSAGSGASVGDDADLGFGLTWPRTSAVDGHHALASQDEVSTSLLLPDGKLASNDPEDLYDLESIILPMVFGEPLNKGELDRLVGLKGVAFCHMWAHWLPQKVAQQYSIGRPVKNPTGLYRRAIEGGWSVNPRWPEFDERRHTVAAQAAAHQRTVNRGLAVSADPHEHASTAANHIEDEIPF